MRLYTYSFKVVMSTTIKIIESTIADFQSLILSIRTKELHSVKTFLKNSSNENIML